MSSLIVEVCKIDEIRPHPNAERLEVAIVKGWQCVVPIALYKTGQAITYIPIDSVIPVALSDKLGVTKYLSNGRVRCAKLRGEPSFGVVAPPFGDLGENVAERLGITKYVPPMRFTVDDVEPNHPLMDPYTDIENMRNFPAIFVDGEPVVATEKVHGTSSAVAIVAEDDGTKVRLARSKGSQRKQSEGSLYWFPFQNPSVVKLLEHFAAIHRQVILYGEIYGRVQSLKYGMTNQVAFRAFDLKLDRRFLDYAEFQGVCRDFGVETCPVLYQGPFSLGGIRALASGASEIPGANNIREGVVVRPIKERTHPTIGRVVLKYVSDEYLLGGQDEPESDEGVPQ